MVDAVLQEYDLRLDLDNRDSDLRSIEKNYFGRDGAFFVAEKERELIAIAGVHKKTDDACVLRRVVVAKPWRRQGVGRELMKMVMSFAKDLDYRRVEVDREELPECWSFLMHIGFKRPPGQEETGPLVASLR